MRKFAALILALALMMTTVALADTTITITGSGEIPVAADTAVISLGVSYQDADVQKAQARVNETIAAIRALLTENGIPQESLNTDFLNIYALYDYSETEEKVVAYRANNNLAIQVKDMEQVGEIIDLAFSAGANTLNGVSFSAKNVDEIKPEAMKAAVADARAKAEILAAAAGLKITGIEAISEGATYSYDRGISNFANAKYDMEEDAGSYGTYVQAAKLAVSSTVTIVFKAE